MVKQETPVGKPHIDAVGRITSIDALRGLVMFVMIVVNNLSPVPNTIVPWWMKHFHGPNGMTFVDMVYPGFLFIVGVSIPFALQSRLNKGESRLRTFGHVVVRWLSLLGIGIMMVNGTPNSEQMGWSGDLWVALMYAASILAFSVLIPPRPEQAKTFRICSMLCRYVGLAAMVALALAFRHKGGWRMVSLSPFHIAHMWWGILGAIGWAYLMSSIAFLLFGANLVALLGCAVLMMCFYPDHIANGTNTGIVYGSHPAITAFGLVLGAMLLSTEAREVRARIYFTLLFIAGCAAAAWMLYGSYGISKEQATPSWCLIGCALTSALWLLFYWISDLQPVKFVSRPLALAGGNVLLAYLLSYFIPAALRAAGLGDWYAGLAEPSLANALMRSVGTSLLVLALATGLNRAGFRLKL